MRKYFNIWLNNNKKEKKIKINKKENLNEMKLNNNNNINPKIEKENENNNKINVNKQRLSERKESINLKSLEKKLNEDIIIPSYQNNYKLISERKKIRNKTQENFYDNKPTISVKKNYSRKKSLNLDLNDFSLIKTKNLNKSVEKEIKSLKCYTLNNSYVYNSKKKKIQNFLKKRIKKINNTNSILKKRILRWKFNALLIKNPPNLTKIKKNFNCSLEKKRYKNRSLEITFFDNNKILNTLDNSYKTKKQKRKSIISIIKKRLPFNFDEKRPVNTNRNKNVLKFQNENKSYNKTNSFNSSYEKFNKKSNVNDDIIKYSKENSILLNSNIDYYKSINDNSLCNEEFIKILKQQNRILLCHKFLLIYRKYNEDKNKVLKFYFKKWRGQNGYFINYLNEFNHIIKNNEHCISCNCLNKKNNLKEYTLSNDTNCTNCNCEKIFQKLKKIMFSLYGEREVNIVRYIIKKWYKKTKKNK